MAYQKLIWLFQTWLLSLLLIVATSNCVLARTDFDADLRDALAKAVTEADSFNDRFDAQVWLMDMSGRLQRYIPDTDERLEFLKNVHYEAKRADLPPELVLAVIHVESAFNRWAISSVGARGLMQVMPFWLKELKRENDNLFNVQTNLRFGCTILRHYLNREKGDLTKALARYNGSVGRAKYPRKVFNRLRNRWFKR